MMAVASHCGMLVSDPRFQRLSQEELALHGAQIEREKKEVDERFGILAAVESKGRLMPEDAFPRLCAAAPTLGNDRQYQRDVALWVKGR